MRDDRKEIVWHWFDQAQDFWILFKVGTHQLCMDRPMWHLHALAVELMIKAAILTREPSAGTWAGFSSLEIFRVERHDIVALLKRWNKIGTDHAIPSVFTSELCVMEPAGEKRFAQSIDTLESLARYNDLTMTGRYMEGKGSWAGSTISAGEFVFFRLRGHIRTFLDLSDDRIDRMFKGSIGRCKDDEWLRRAARICSSGDLHRIEASGDFVPVETREFFI